MKKTFKDIQECIHIFAQFTQDSGKCGNVFFEGNTIYSYGYHFPMAQRINLGAMPVILINGRSYSNSTGKHQSWTRSALSHYTQIISFGMDRNGTTTKESHEKNEQYYIGELAAIARKLVTARKPATYAQQADSLHNTFSQYCNFFGIGSSEQYRTAYTNATNVSPEILQAAKQAAKEKKASEKKAIELKVSEWLSGERLYFPTECLDKTHDVLRLRPNGQEVETSKGVTMSIGEAKAIYSQLLAQTLKAGDTVLNHYKVTSINGTVKIGCHTFDTQYLLDFGQKLTGIHPVMAEIIADTNKIKNS